MGQHTKGFPDNIDPDITKGENTLHRLGEREVLFSKVFRTDPALYTIAAIFPGHGLFVDVSEAFLTTFGYHREEIIGRTTSELNIWVQAELRGRMMEILQRDNTVNNFEVSFKTKSGEIRNCLISADPIEYKGQNHILMVFTDITERLRAERKLYESEEKFRSIVTNALPITFVIDAEGTFVLSEGKSLAALNETPADAIGKNTFEVYKNCPDIIHGFQRALNDESYSDVVTVRGVAFDIVYSPWKNTDDRVIGAVGMAIDITGRKCAEDALKESQERFRDFAESSSDWFWEQDENLRFTAVSTEVYDKSGIHANDHIGKVR